jgi:hypothetical protein
MGRDAQLVLEARVGEEWLVTDEWWRVLRSRAWRGLGAGQALEGVPIKLLDARELDPFWMEPNFDDSSWVEATVLKATHDGRSLRGSQSTSAGSLPATSNWRSRPRLGLDLFYQESGDYDAVAGPVASAARSSASYITRGFADHYEAVDINGLRQVFLMIPPGAGEITVRDLAVSEYHYPFTGGAAFTSSDPELNQLYQAGIRTTEMNSFDAFTDCPTREQRAWVGDGVVHQMVHLVANEDWRLARNYVRSACTARFRCDSYR